MTDFNIIEIFVKLDYISLKHEVGFLPGRSVGGCRREGTWILLWVELVLAATTTIEDKVGTVFIINYLLKKYASNSLFKIFILKN